MKNAYSLGEEAAASQCSDGGGFYEVFHNSSLEELRKFAKRVGLNGEHDNFDSVFFGVDVPFTEKDEAEEFRAGYMNAVWSHVTNRITLLEDEARFTADVGTGNAQ